jgi:hypothetical protein
MLDGVIEVLGGFVGRWVRAVIPRTAMLGTLAGGALTFVAGELFFQTFSAPIVGSVVLIIILIGMVGKTVMPFKIPTAILAIVLGTILAYILDVADVKTSQLPPVLWASISHFQRWQHSKALRYSLVNTPIFWLSSYPYPSTTSSRR